LKQTTGYLAPLDLQANLRNELKNILFEYDRLIIAEGPPQTAYWAQNIWFDPQIIHFTSISDAAKKLKDLQKLWSLYPYKNIRRATLISEKLPYFSAKPILFPSSVPKTPLGSWTLLDENTLLASPHCSSFFAQGEVYFQESKAPPSRAYLKLWEALTRIGIVPQPNEVCLEVGASPGSWTWVLQQLGCSVIAVDRALLDPSISILPNITFMKKDAFSLKPTDFSKLDWIFSDLICYPEKLLLWINQWLDLNEKMNFVCTLKFQGEPDQKIIKEFEKIEGGQIVHLFHNKHELTWVKIGKKYL
jgi:23S rRNA (cytidine2498-2'-O)-methyltransferase